MSQSLDRSKSLEELEGVDWGEPTWQSNLVITCHQLHRKPLVDFTVADLTRMIGQQLSLQHLIPMALELLGANPLIGGDYYNGDLLKSVTRVSSEFWDNHPEHCLRARGLLERAKAVIPSADKETRETIEMILKEANRRLRD